MGIFRRNNDHDPDNPDGPRDDAATFDAIMAANGLDGADTLDGPGGELVPFPRRPDPADRLPDVPAPGGRSGNGPGLVPDGPRSPDRDGDGTEAVPDEYADYPDIDGDGIPDGTPDNPLVGELVDSPEAQRPDPWTLDRFRTAQRRPILPAWAKSKAEARDALKVTGGHAVYAAAYHVTRVPKYTVKLAARSPLGAVRVVSGTVRWLFDTTGEPVRQAAVRHEDAAEYLALVRHRDHRVRWRGIITAAASVAAIVAAVAVVSADEWVRWTALAVLIAGLGIAGRPADRPLLDTAVQVPQVPKLTSEHVIRALSVLGIAGINQALSKNPRAVAFVAPVRQDGPGWRADVDLPPGVTSAEVMERRDKLAAGLSRPLGAVWPEANPDIHPGRLTLWVGREDMATAKQQPWPLLKSGTVDLFRPFPFGTDPRGRPVTMELVSTNVLIGSIPGAGKTFSLRVPLLAAALDKRAELWVFELKGTGDLEPLAKVATRYGSGPDDETIEQALFGLRDLRKELARRAKVIAGLPKADCPENKVTPDLAAKRSLKLHPLVVAVDECQELFTHPAHGKEAGDLAEKIIKLGRALGVILMLATQRPDSNSLPTGVSANVGTRYCLRVMGQVENDMILGTSAYKNGTRATMFTRRDKGVGYLVGASDDPQIVKTFYVDGPAADRITDRARRLREAAGTLTGHAAGELDPGKPREDTLLEDLLTVCPPSEGNGKFWTETVHDRLAKYRPDVYADQTRDQLTAALRRHGIATGQVWGTTDDGAGANRRGINAADVEEIVADRNRRKGGDTAT